MPQIAEKATINGVEVQRMGQTVKATQDNPHVAIFRFQAANRSKTGGHDQSAIHRFYAAGQVETGRTEPCLIEADGPPVLFGQDQAPNPADDVLHALAACLTTSLVCHAAARDIRVHSVESRPEGDLDLRGVLGVSDSIRPVWQQVRVHVVVEADASAEELHGLTTFSPVSDIVSRPVPVEITIETTTPTV